MILAKFRCWLHCLLRKHRQEIFQSLTIHRVTIVYIRCNDCGRYFYRNKEAIAILNKQGWKI